MRLGIGDRAPGLDFDRLPVGTIGAAAGQHAVSKDLQPGNRSRIGQQQLDGRIGVAGAANGH